MSNDKKINITFVFMPWLIYLIFILSYYIIYNKIRKLQKIKNNKIIFRKNYVICYYNYNKSIKINTK